MCCMRDSFFQLWTSAWPNTKSNTQTKEPLPGLILKSWKTSATIAAYLQHIHDCRSIVNPKAPVNKFRPCFFFSPPHSREVLQCSVNLYLWPPLLFYQLFNKEAVCTFQKHSLVFVEFPSFFFCSCFKSDSEETSSSYVVPLLQFIRLIWHGVIYLIFFPLQFSAAAISDFWN